MLDHAVHAAPALGVADLIKRAALPRRRAGPGRRSAHARLATIPCGTIRVADAVDAQAPGGVADLPGAGAGAHAGGPLDAAVVRTDLRGAAVCVGHAGCAAARDAVAARRAPRTPAVAHARRRRRVVRGNIERGADLWCGGEVRRRHGIEGNAGVAHAGVARAGVGGRRQPVPDNGGRAGCEEPRENQARNSHERPVSRRPETTSIRGDRSRMKPLHSSLAAAGEAGARRRGGDRGREGCEGRGD